MTRNELFNARNVSELFALLSAYLDRAPTCTEMRTWTHTVLGPCCLSPEIRAQCA